MQRPYSRITSSLHVYLFLFFLCFCFGFMACNQYIYMDCLRSFVDWTRSEHNQIVMTKSNRKNIGQIVWRMHQFWCRNIPYKFEERVVIWFWRFATTSIEIVKFLVCIYIVSVRALWFRVAALASPINLVPIVCLIVKFYEPVFCCYLTDVECIRR